MKKNIIKILTLTLVFCLCFNGFIYATNTDEYAEEVNKIRIIEPPSNWDAVNASDEELEYYGYPTKPKDPDDLKKWKEIVSSKWIKPKFVNTNKKKSSTFNITNATIQNGPNWSGYIQTVGGTVSSIDAVEGNYTVPSVYAPSSYRPAYASQWVGLGGAVGTNPSLAQAGTATQFLSNGSAKYYFWIQIVNTSFSEDEKAISNLSVNPGESVYIQITATNVNTTNKTADVYFYICNKSKGVATTFSVSLTNVVNLTTSSEWILERPSLNGSNGYFPRTTSYGVDKVFFTGCKYIPNKSQYVYFADNSYAVKTNIYESYTRSLLTETSSVNSYGDFNVRWLWYY